MPQNPHFRSSQVTLNSIEAAKWLIKPLIASTSRRAQETLGGFLRPFIEQDLLEVAKQQMLMLQGRGVLGFQCWV